LQAVVSSLFLLERQGIEYKISIAEEIGSDGRGWVRVDLHERNGKKTKDELIDI
jgi:hypothetical protein